jgi:hypothetical protein
MVFFEVYLLVPSRCLEQHTPKFFNWYKSKKLDKFWFWAKFKPMAHFIFPKNQEEEWKFHDDIRMSSLSWTEDEINMHKPK